jgi:hypothetical protein
MSKIALSGNASGTGTFTIASPNSNSDRTLNLPDASGTLNTSGAPNEVPAGSAAAPAIYPAGDTNTGIFFPGADRIGFAEGGAQVGEFDSAGNFKFNSGYGSVATAYGCRAWVNFNGTGTVAIRASGNVSSITDNGTGDYTVNFTTAMPDANYSAVGSSRNSTTRLTIVSPQHAGVADPFTTTTARFRTSDNDAVANDSDIVSVAIFR